MHLDYGVMESTLIGCYKEIEFVHHFSLDLYHFAYLHCFSPFFIIYSLISSNHLPTFLLFNSVIPSHSINEDNKSACPLFSYLYSVLPPLDCKRAKDNGNKTSE
jgi:hypothetical protein